MKNIIIKNEVDRCYSNFDTLEILIKENENIIILGNGGSSSVASHIAQDYTKMLNKRSFTFSDASRLTCYTNDYGYEDTYLQFLKEFVREEEKTLVILISSSGNSENIVRCAEWCNKSSNIDIVTLTGFDENNRLRKMHLKNRKINHWVDSNDYGIVECVHMIFLHMVV